MVCHHEQNQSEHRLIVTHVCKLKKTAVNTSVWQYQKFYATIHIVKKYRDIRYYRDT